MRGRAFFCVAFVLPALAAAQTTPAPPVPQERGGEATPAALLISITPRDLSFIVEENLSDIFRLFARHRVRITLMQNSAVAFSVAVDDTPQARDLVDELRGEYEVRYNEGCELVTLRHFDEPTVQRLTGGREILIEQRSRNTARFVMK